MDERSFINRLYGLDAADQAGIAALGAAAADDARRAARRIVPVLDDPRPETAQKGVVVLSRLEDLAAVALLEAPVLAEPRQQVWLMRTAVEAALDLRGDVLKKLEAMLGDDDPLEESGDPQGPRVCDHAFLLIGRLLAFARSTAWHGSFAAAFLSLKPEQRDEKISRAREARVWPLD